MTKKPNKETLPNAKYTPFKRKDGKCPECGSKECEARFKSMNHATHDEIYKGDHGESVSLIDKENKPKLFEDYESEIHGGDVDVLWTQEKEAIKIMLNDLAHQIYELNEKMDFVMNEVTVAKVEESCYYYETLKNRYK